MKNKKLIATVASLCLVLVAVVAAVIGVLAAAQQNVTNHISIRYEANDVYATVSATAWTELNSTVQNLMPNDVEQGQDQTYSAAYTFNRTTAQATKAAKLVDETLASNNKYVVYKLVFTNNMTGYALNVSGAFTLAASGNENARLFVQNPASSEGSAIVPTYDETTGKLSNALSLGEELTSSKTLTSITSVAAATQAETFTPTSDTIFLILCIDDLNVPASYLLGTKDNNTGATLDFTLTRGTKVGSGS